MKFADILGELLLAPIIGMIAACVEVGELREESRNIPLGEAESAEVKLRMQVGKLNLQGGAKELLEAIFIYNVPLWKPEVHYNLSGKRGRLSVKQGDAGKVRGDTIRNRWDINLNNDIPTDLKINLGAGKSELDLRGLLLNSLEIETGVGQLELDLRGDRKRDMDVTIEGGVGSAIIYLPSEIGVRIEIDSGIGAINARQLNKSGSVYTNNAFGKTDVSINMKIEAGIGSIDLILK